MGFHIIEAVRAHFSPGVVQNLARIYGEDGGSLQRGVDAAIPAIASGIVTQASSDTGAAHLLVSLRESGFDAPTLGRLSGMLDGGPQTTQLAERGQSLLPGLLGSKRDAVLDQLARFAGLQGSTASSLLGLVAPLALGTLGRYAQQERLGAQELHELLAGQRELVRNAMPAGFHFEAPQAAVPRPIQQRVPEVGTPASVAAVHGERSLEHRTIHPVQTRDRPAGMGRFLWPALIALLLVFAWSMFRNRGGTERDALTGSAPVSERQARSPSSTDRPASEVPRAREGTMGTTGPEQTLQLPGGGSVSAPEGSGLYQLAQTLAAGAAGGAAAGAVGGSGAQRFVLDEVRFQEGRAELAGQGRTEVQELAEVLEAYPQARVRIEGHTAGGGEPSNRQLSQERADAVKDALVQQGVAANRVEAVGHGDSDPVAGSGSAEGQDANARTEVILLER